MLTHMQTLYVLNFSAATYMCLQFLSFLHTDVAQVVEIFLMDDKNLPTLYGQYHGCGWLSDSVGQCIRNRDIDPVKQG